MNLDKLDQESLLVCCGSHAWVTQMLASLPVPNAEQLHQLAESIWWSLQPEGWLDAFAAHPQIGQQSSSKWSAQEQAGMSVASQQSAKAMADLNTAYSKKFGFIFIVCATGKTADEMRHLLEQRIANSPEHELRIAAGEQAKIIHLRLDKLLAE
jgi:OHCU decarboxylase